MSKVLQIRIDKDLEDMVKTNSEKLGISAAAYVNQIIRNGNGKMYTLELVTDDISEYTAEIHSAAHAASSMINVIEKSGGDYYAQDIEAMKEYLSEILILMRKQVATSYTNRKKIAAHAQKKILKILSDSVKD